MPLLALFEFLDAPGSATASDSAGTPQDATFYGDAQADGAGTASFDGNGDYALIDPNPAFDLTTGTIELSFVQDSPSQGDLPYGSSPAQTLFSIDGRNTQDGEISIYVTSSGQISVRHQDDGVDHFYSGGTVSPGQPVEVSYSFGPSGSVLVVNGVTVDTGTTALTMGGGAKPIAIGGSLARATPGTADTVEGFFDGQISRVAIYDDAQGSRAAAPACFALTTRIDTPSGPRPLAQLRPGDLVLTRDGGARPIHRILRREPGPPGAPRPDSLRPVTFAPGTIGNTEPLTLSRQHAVLMQLGPGEVLVRAAHLARDGPPGIRLGAGADAPAYGHILLDAHHMVCAHGVWSETLRPGVPLAGQGARPPNPPCRPILSGRAAREALRAGLLHACPHHLAPACPVG